MKTSMELEISEQAIAFNIARTINKEMMGKIVEEIKKKKYGNIVIAARGSSFNAGMYFKYLEETYYGIPVSFAALSELSLYNGAINLKDSLVIGISQSGKSIDVLNYLKKANEQGADIVTITNDPDSPIAKVSQWKLDLHVGEEQSVAATKTMTIEMYLLAILVAKLKEDNELMDHLDSVAIDCIEVLKQFKSIKEAARKLKYEENILVLGRGFNYCSAIEGALKLQETCYIKARGMAISDCYHGPLASISKGDTVILLLSQGTLDGDQKNIYDKLKENGVNVIVFSNDQSVYFDEGFYLPQTHEAVTPILLIVAMQIFALNLSIERGLNPDKPRNLNKVTLTF